MVLETIAEDDVEYQRMPSDSESVPEFLAVRRVETVLRGMLFVSGMLFMYGLIEFYLKM